MQFTNKPVFQTFIPLFALLILVPLAAFANPGTLENLQYKVTLSETTPGVDDSLIPGLDPLINVDIQDKLHGTGTRYPLKVYAIQEYFFSDNLLNLITRTSPKSSVTKPFYGFLQLNLESASDSRQYDGIRKYYFSSDNRAMIAIFEQGTGGGGGDFFPRAGAVGKQTSFPGMDLFPGKPGEFPEDLSGSRWGNSRAGRNGGMDRGLPDRGLCGFLHRRADRHRPWHEDLFLDPGGSGR